MSRFYIRPDAVDGDRVTFDAEEAHHLVRVLRAQPGSLVQAVDGQGNEFTVRLTGLGGRAADGLIVARAVRATESPIELTLAQGLPKGEKLEGIIRMATELGVARVAPLLCARSIARAGASRPSERLDRWQRIAREAAKQSGRGIVPEVRAPMTLGEWLAETRGSGLIVCLWEGERLPLDDVLPPEPPPRVALVVGPEGGLAPEEVERLREADALVAGLGPRILRTETAGPVGLALLQSRYGDLGRAR